MAEGLGISCLNLDIEALPPIGHKRVEFLHTCAEKLMPDPVSWTGDSKFWRAKARYTFLDMVETVAASENQEFAVSPRLRLRLTAYVSRAAETLGPRPPTEPMFSKRTSDFFQALLLESERVVRVHGTDVFSPGMGQSLRSLTQLPRDTQRRLTAEALCALNLPNTLYPHRMQAVSTGV